MCWALYPYELYGGEGRQGGSLLYDVVKSMHFAGKGLQFELTGFVSLVRSVGSF